MVIAVLDCNIKCIQVKLRKEQNSNSEFRTSWACMKGSTAIGIGRSSFDDTRDVNNFCPSKLVLSNDKVVSVVQHNDDISISSLLCIWEAYTCKDIQNFTTFKNIKSEGSLPRRFKPKLSLAPPKANTLGYREGSTL